MLFWAFPKKHCSTKGHVTLAGRRDAPPFANWLCGRERTAHNINRYLSIAVSFQWVALLRKVKTLCVAVNMASFHKHMLPVCRNQTLADKHACLTSLFLVICHDLQRCKWLNLTHFLLTWTFSFTCENVQFPFNIFSSQVNITMWNCD